MKPLFAQGHEDTAVDSERIDLLYRQSIPGFIATAVNATIILIALYGVIDERIVFAWYAALIFVTVLRFVLSRRYLGQPRNQRQLPHWGQLFVLGTLTSGVLWGIAATVMLPLHSALHQTIILVTIAGMAAGGAVLLAPSRQAYYTYILPILLPLCLWMFLQPSLIHKLIGVLVASYLLTLISLAHRLHGMIRESLRLRNERRDLIDDLARSRELLQNSNNQLSDMIVELIDKGRELRESSQFLARIMDSATNAIFVLDLQGRVTHANDTTCEITNYQRAQLLGKSFASLALAETGPRVGEVIESTAYTGETIKNFEIDIMRQDGFPRIISCTFTPLQEGDDIEAIVGTAEDITERKRVERLKDEFISTVSHELRTPLTSIRGALGLIHDSPSSMDPKQQNMLVDIAYKNCERLIYLINDLLDVQKLEAGEMHFAYTDLALSELVEEAVTTNQSYANQYQVIFRVHNNAPQIEVRADRQRLMQVLANLLSNAAKYSPTGETVAVEITRRTLHARVSVIDRGPGIPDEFRNRIFQKFAQLDASDRRQRGGTGLGLSLSKDIVEHMGGRIGFTSEVGQGTEFFIDLPLAQGA